MVEPLKAYTNKYQVRYCVEIVYCIQIVRLSFPRRLDPPALTSHQCPKLFRCFEAIKEFSPSPRSISPSILTFSPPPLLPAFKFGAGMFTFFLFPDRATAEEATPENASWEGTLSSPYPSLGPDADDQESGPIHPPFVSQEKRDSQPG